MRRVLKWIGLSLGGLIVFGVLWVFWFWRHFAPPPLNPSVENPIYSRSDCMVRTEVTYPRGATDDDADDIGAGIHWSFSETIREKRFPVAAVGIGWADLRSNYIIFSNRCDKKFEMVEELVRTYRETHPDGAKLKVTHDRVIPSTMLCLTPLRNIFKPSSSAKGWAGALSSLMETLHQMWLC